jgi:hypothetical protein
LEWGTMRSRRWQRFCDIGNFVPVRFPVSVQRNTKTAENCSPISPTVWIWPPQTTTCSDLRKITWDVTTLRLTRQFRKPCEAGYEKLEQASTAETFLRFCNVGSNA